MKSPSITTILNPQESTTAILTWKVSNTYSYVFADMLNKAYGLKLRRDRTGMKTETKTGLEVSFPCYTYYAPLEGFYYALLEIPATMPSTQLRYYNLLMFIINESTCNDNHWKKQELLYNDMAYGPTVREPLTLRERLHIAELRKMRNFVEQIDYFRLSEIGDIKTSLVPVASPNPRMSRRIENQYKDLFDAMSDMLKNLYHNFIDDADESFYAETRSKLWGKYPGFMVSRMRRLREEALRKMQEEEANRRREALLAHEGEEKLTQCE